MSDKEKEVKLNPNSQNRKWLLTINNPKEKEMTHEQIKIILSKFKAVKYWCMCDEIGGKQNIYHTHLFIKGDTPIKFNTVKNKFPTAHIDYCRGTNQENRDYIRKEGKYKGTDKEETNLKDTFEESGECPGEHQGKRNDYLLLYDCIKEGMSNFDILEMNANYMVDLDKIEYCRQIVKEEEFKNKIRELEVEYRFGCTGTGKSRTIIERFGFENVFRITDQKHPFDTYSGQDVIVFEEFYSSNFRISEMLNYLDIYPLVLPCRYRNKIACYTKVFINSNIPLEKQYTEVQKNSRETWLAFLRRINCVKEFNEQGSIKDYKNIDEYITRWQAVNPKDTPFHDDKENMNPEEIYQYEMNDLVNDWIVSDYNKNHKKG